MRMLRSAASFRSAFKTGHAATIDAILTLSKAFSTSEVPKCSNSLSKRKCFSRLTRENLRSGEKEPKENLMSAILIGRPNVGKSALFNRLCRRRDAIVLNTPGGHVTRDLRDGVAKLGDVRFRVIDSAGVLADCGVQSVLYRTAKITQSILTKCHFAFFLIDGREGLQPLDFEVAKWLRSASSSSSMASSALSANLNSLKIITIVNKCEGLEGDSSMSLSIRSTIAESFKLGFGDPIPLSAETGEGLITLYETIAPYLQEYSKFKEPEKEGIINDVNHEAEHGSSPIQENTQSIIINENLRCSENQAENDGAVEVVKLASTAIPSNTLIEDYETDGAVIENVNENNEIGLFIERNAEAGSVGEEGEAGEGEDTEVGDEEAEKAIPLQFAIAGRPNVGKSTLFNSLVGEERVVTGPEPGLTRDSIRVQFTYNDRKIFLVDTAGWLKRAQLREATSSLSNMDAKKNLMRSQVVALLLDGKEIAEAKKTLRRSEMNLARWILEEGRALIVVVNKMDLVQSTTASSIQKLVKYAVPKELHYNLQQVVNIPVVFLSALKPGVSDILMPRVMQSYVNWSTRISTSRLNRWLTKLVARNPVGGISGKVRYLTQVKARPPTFVAFTSGSSPVPESDIRFLANSLAQDFDLDGTPIRVYQRHYNRLNNKS